MHSKYLKKLEWNSFFYSLQEYGKQFINEKDVDLLVLKSKDFHTIPFRILNGFPTWITDQIPIKIELIQLFSITPNSLGMVHKDGISRFSALNIPVLNCNLGYMDWFDKDYQQVLYDNKYTKVRLTLDEDDHRPFRIEDNPSYQTLVDTPSIINTNIWHRIDNRKNNNYRWMLSIRFCNNPSFESLCSLF